MSTASIKNESVCIVIARAEIAEEWNGKPFAGDLGHRPTMTTVVRSYAATWLLCGTAEDVAKAQQYCDKSPDGWRVYTFPANEKDPLEKARRLVSGKRA